MFLIIFNFITITTMKVQFNVTTKSQEYTAVLNNLTPDEHALLLHLKYKLNQAYENSEIEDNFLVTLNVLPE